MTSTKGTSQFQRLVATIVAIAAGLGNSLSSALSFLAESTDINSDKNTSDSVRGGIFNYRTGKLDDGTDATGWYEKD